MTRQTVLTREGDPVAEPGDWIVTDARGITWPVSRAVFETLYEEGVRGDHQLSQTVGDRTWASWAARDEKGVIVARRTKGVLISNTWFALAVRRRSVPASERPGSWPD